MLTRKTRKQAIKRERRYRELASGMPSEMELYASNCMTREEQRHQDMRRRKRRRNEQEAKDCGK